MTPDNLISTSCRDAEIWLMDEAERRPDEAIGLVNQTLAELNRMALERKSLRRVLLKARRKAWLTKWNMEVIHEKQTHRPQ